MKLHAKYQFVASAYLAMFLNAFFCFAGTVSAQAVSQTTSTPIDLFTSPFKPYSFETANAPDGIFADVVREIEKVSKLSFRTQFVPWKRALVTTQERAADAPGLIYPLIRSDEREKSFQWLCRILEDEPVFFVSSGAKTEVTIDELKKERVGVTHGSPLELELRSEKFTLLESVVGTDTNAVKLAHGRIRAWYVPRLVGLYTFRSNKIDPSRFQVVTRGRSEQLFLAASPSLPSQVAEKIKSACAEVQSTGFIVRTIQRYIQPVVAQNAP